jgi:hypothetical protein
MQTQMKSTQFFPRQSLPSLDRMSDLSLNLVLYHLLNRLQARFEILGWQILARGAELVLIVKPYAWVGAAVFIIMFILGYVAAMTGF